MAEKLSREEIKKYCWVFIGSVLFLIFMLETVYFAVDIDTFYQYIELPNKIEHNRYFFILLYIPLVAFSLLVVSAYELVMKKKMPEKQNHQLGMFVVYGGFIALLMTPLFSIASGFYLDYHGYERCPDNERGAYSSVRILDYAKSPEYCPPLN